MLCAQKITVSFCPHFSKYVHGYFISFVLQLDTFYRDLSNLQPKHVLSVQIIKIVRSFFNGQLKVKMLTLCVRWNACLQRRLVLVLRNNSSIFWRIISQYKILFMKLIHSNNSRYVLHEIILYNFNITKLWQTTKINSKD